jgi:hypothetical protein
MFALTVALSLGAFAMSVAITRATSDVGSSLPPQVAATPVLPTSAIGWLGALLTIMQPWAFAALGTLIVSHQPAHAIGWLFCAIGVELTVELFTDMYAVYALLVEPGALPGGLVAGWLQNWIWFVGVALFVVFVPLRFPSGQLVSARWRPAWWVAVGVTAAGVLLVAFAPGPFGNVLDGAGIHNPFGVAYLAAATPVLIFVLLIVFLTSTLLAAASLVVRLRHARGVERQQIKWFAYIAILLALLFVLQTVVFNVLGISFPPVNLAVSLAWGVALVGLPIVTGLAILRYHLFDIDVLIRRTLIYGTLSVLLVCMYFGCVLGAQAVIQALTGQTKQHPAVVVTTTLLLAGLFTPLRHGIQRFIDLRFYRSKYDVARTLAAFGATLRTETDLGALSERLVMAVQETMHPAHVSLWLREPLRAISGARLTAGDLPGSPRQSGDTRAM